MISVLTIINNELKTLNLPYTFDNWDCEVELPQFIGEISESSNQNEDGKSTYSFILTGYATTYEELFKYSEMLKNRYKSSLLVNGVVIKYENTTTINNGTEDLKQIQINFTIKKWSV